MKLQLRIATGIALPLLFLAACQKEIKDLPVISEEVSSKGGSGKLKNDELELNISGLENLGASARYEGWVIIDGSPVTTGTFTVNNAGELSQTIFEIPTHQGKLKNATAFVLTLEPYPDNSPAPSNQRLLGGNFSDANASLSIGRWST